MRSLVLAVRSCCALVAGRAASSTSTLRAGSVLASSCSHRTTSGLLEASSQKPGGLVESQRQCMGRGGSKMAAPVIIPATARHTATVIFLHGLGDTGHGWSGELQRISLPHVKYICPTAPSIPVALNMGMRMPAWFNLFSLDMAGPEDEQGIKAASDNIQKMIADEESAGIPAERIMLGGFSMGGALALYSGLTNQKKIAGIVGLSTWLPMHAQVPAKAAANSATPIFMGHGDSDDLVPMRWGQMTVEAIKKFNPQVTFNTYRGMGHSSCSQEMKDVQKFIEERLPAN